MLKHSVSTPTPVQDLNGAVNQKELMNVIESLRQEIRQTQAKPVQPPMMIPIATPPYDAMSACAGFPPGQSPKKFPEGPSPYKSPDPGPFKWSDTATAIPRGSDSSSSSSSGGPPGPPGGGPNGGSSQGGSSPHSQRGWQSIGIGSADVITEESVYRYKALQPMKIDSLPQDAGAFRGWRNGIVTRLCSIDVTGKNIILDWILEALDPIADLNASSRMALPRLEAYIAAVLAEPKHLKGDLGVQFQAYCEQCQQQKVSPKGIFMLQMIAKRFQLDLNRDANLTQQSFLELTLDSYTQEGLSKFIERIELVLKSIPPTHQPSEMTKFTWLFSRLKPCRSMQRFIDRIKDAREGSHVKTWDWLYDKLQRVVIEMREDINEESVRRTLSPTKPKQDRPKGDGKGKDVKANVAVDTDDKGEKALPGPAKPKPKAKADSKGGGKEGGKQQPKAAPQKPKASQPKPKAKPKAEATGSQNRSSVPCLFYPNGTCNRGESCPFFHDPKAKPAAKPKATAATSSAKATVAVISAAQGVSGASAVSSASQTSVSSGFGWELLQASLRAFVRPFIALASLFSCIGQPQLSAHSAALWASPAVVSHNSSAALSAKMSDSFQLEWIADSGAGRDLASERAFLEQGVPMSFVQSCTQSCKPIKI